MKILWLSLLLATLASLCYGQNRCSGEQNFECTTDADCLIYSTCVCAGLTPTCDRSDAVVSHNDCAGSLAECYCQYNVTPCAPSLPGIYGPNGECEFSTSTQCSTTRGGGCRTESTAGCVCVGNNEVCTDTGSIPKNITACVGGVGSCSCYDTLGACTPRACTNWDECTDFVDCNGEETCVDNFCAAGTTPCTVQNNSICGTLQGCNISSNQCYTVREPACQFPSICHQQYTFVCNVTFLLIYRLTCLELILATGTTLRTNASPTMQAIRLTISHQTAALSCASWGTVSIHQDRRATFPHA
jgi:hypothetical protein